MNGHMFGTLSCIRGDVSAGESTLRNEKVSDSTGNQRVVIYHKGRIEWK